MRPDTEVMPVTSRKRAKRKVQHTTARGLKLDPQHPWRHENVGRLLLSSLINWQDVLVRGLQEKGFPRFRASHMNLLRHIDLGGTRITEIAGRSRMSKQAVGQLLVSCEAEKLVTTIPDPTDRRAKIVIFTNLGRAVIDAEREVMERIDAELSNLLGADGFTGLRRELSVLAEWSGPFAGSRKKTRSSKSRQRPRQAA